MVIITKVEQQKNELDYYKEGTPEFIEQVHKVLDTPSINPIDELLKKDLKERYLFEEVKVDVEKAENGDVPIEAVPEEEKSASDE